MTKPPSAIDTIFEHVKATLTLPTDDSVCVVRFGRTYQLCCERPDSSTMRQLTPEFTRPNMMIQYITDNAQSIQAMLNITRRDA